MSPQTLVSEQQALLRLKALVGPGRRYPLVQNLAAAAGVSPSLVSMMWHGKKPICGRVMRLLGLEHARAYTEAAP